MKKLVIIDGSSVLTSCFYGQTPNGFAIAKTDEERARYHKNMLQTSDGRFVNAVYGMTKYLLRLFKEINPFHVIVTWDTTRNTFRRTIYPEYKMNRKDTAFELSSQFPIMQDFLRKLGVKQYLNDINEKDMSKLYESDDFIGSLVKKYEDEMSIAIISKDRDMLQLVSENTSVWLITSKCDELNTTYYENASNRVFAGTVLFTPEIVKQETGVYPNQIVDLKALLGDTADNIPGIKGVGETSAPQLITEYGCIENLFDTIRHLSGLETLTDKKEIKALKDEIKEIKEFWKTDLGINKSPLNALLKTSKDELVGEESAKISKELGQIKLDIPIIEVLSDFEFEINQTKLIELLKELEFSSLINRISSNPVVATPQQQSLF